MPLNSEIQELWNEHSSASFPKGYGGNEIDSIDLALLDTETAGCIQTFINNDCHLDVRRVQVLKHCLDNLTVVTKKLDGNALRYFTRIKTLAALILQEIGNNSSNNKD